MIDIEELQTSAKIGSVSADGVEATIYSKQIGGGSVGPFTVTHFDTPLVDNIKLGEFRIALLLQGSEGGSPKVRFIAFPKHLAADRFDIKEQSREYRDKLR